MILPLLPVLGFVVWFKAWQEEIRTSHVSYDFANLIEDVLMTSYVPGVRWDNRREPERLFCAVENDGTIIGPLTNNGFGEPTCSFIVGNASYGGCRLWFFRRNCYVIATSESAFLQPEIRRLIEDAIMNACHRVRDPAVIERAMGRGQGIYDRALVRALDCYQRDEPRRSVEIRLIVDRADRTTGRWHAVDERSYFPGRRS